MKLSEAIVLGDTLKRANPAAWMSLDCTQGCALGGAMLATGRWKAPLRQPIDPKEAIKAAWPWLAGGFGHRIFCISEMYAEVCEKRRSFESLVQWVKDHEPECGECNRFECTCSKPAPMPVRWVERLVNTCVYHRVFPVEVTASTNELVSTE